MNGYCTFDIIDVKNNIHIKYFALKLMRRHFRLYKLYYASSLLFHKKKCNYFDS